MSKRIAYVVCSSTGDELTGGNHDASRMFSVLTRSDLGSCHPSSPPPVIGCTNRDEFYEGLLECLTDWNSSDQLIFYYSGHGNTVNGKYVLKFGDNSLLPFDNIMSDLTAHGVERAILIIDACQSGEILKKGLKSNEQAEIAREEDLPSGIALVSSCRDKESSYELQDGSASVFTTLLAEAMETGLNGKATEDGRISVEDAIGYVNDKLSSENYRKFPQTPAFGIHQADRSIWLSKNSSLTDQVLETPTGDVKTIEELRILYENSAPSSLPCHGCKIEDLDWDLVCRFADQSGLDRLDDKYEMARRLGLYSQINPEEFSRAAVLCFAKRPHAFIEQARSVLIFGQSSSMQIEREDITGPLSHQISKIYDSVESKVMSELPPGEDISHFSAVVREALSNAITHRDYEKSGHVRVQMEFPNIEIQSPGSFPDGLNWSGLISARPSSTPNDPAIAWYLTALQVAETIGRGFELYRTYRESFGVDALVHDDNQHNAVVIAIRCEQRENNTFGEEETKERRDVRQLQHTQAFDLLNDMPELDEKKSGDSLPTRLAGCSILEMLGEGGSASVYLGYQDALDRKVAIKTLFQRFGSTTQKERFLQESRIAASISHPNIVPIFEVGEEGDYYFIVMEYVEGDSLDKIIQNQGAMQEEEAAEITLQIATGLAAAHRALIIHRDIKPGNIIIDLYGTAKITDFGIARTSESDTVLTRTGVILGTPAYLSPEQFMGKSIGFEADVYSLGVILYEMLTGTNPWTGQSPAAIGYEKVNKAPPLATGVDPNLAAICQKAMRVEPEARYSSAIELADAIKVWMERTDHSKPAGRFSWWPFKTK